MTMRKHSKSTDVTKVNPFNVSYIKGNEFTDGSIRIIPGTDGQIISVELRTTGVWNEIGIITENLVYDNNLNTVLNNSLNPIYSNPF